MARDRREVVGAEEAVRQMVGEDRERDIQGMAGHMDDRRLGEDEPDQAEVGLVERHLIGEPIGALAHRVELAGALQIIVAQVVEALGLVAEPELRERLGIGERAREHARHEGGQLVDDRQLVAGRNARMGTETLLDHRGA